MGHDYTRDHDIISSFFLISRIGSNININALIVFIDRHLIHLIRLMICLPVIGISLYARDVIHTNVPYMAF